MEVKKQILIVGGLGYFGSRLAKDLSRNFNVTVTARKLTPIRAAWLERNTQIRFLPFDSAKDGCLPVTDRFESIINLASPSSYEAVDDFSRAHSSAIRTLSAIAQLLREGLAEKLVHFSSFHVYGQPMNKYGEIHLSQERYLTERLGTLPVVVLRATNGVGYPEHSELGVQSRLLFLDCCRQAVESFEIKLLSDGSSFRDFITLTEFISAVRVVLAHPFKSLETLNLSSGKMVPLRNLVSLIQDRACAVLNRQIPISFGGKKDPIAEPFIVSNDPLRLLGWAPEPVMGIEIDKTLEFFREALDQTEKESAIIFPKSQDRSVTGSLV